MSKTATGPYARPEPQRFVRCPCCNTTQPSPDLHAGHPDGHSTIFHCAQCKCQVYILQLDTEGQAQRFVRMLQAPSNVDSCGCAESTTAPGTWECPCCKESLIAVDLDMLCARHSPGTRLLIEQSYYCAPCRQEYVLHEVRRGRQSSSHWKALKTDACGNTPHYETLSDEASPRSTGAFATLQLDS